VQRLGINPRIAAADVEAEAAATSSRRRRRLATVTIAVVAVICGGGLVLLSPLASVRTIKVIGADRSGEAAVRAASGLASGPPLVRLDTDVVIARIVALPWVLGVRLERRWPRTVVVSVEERQPVALAPCQGPSGPAGRGAQGGTASCLVDASGRVLAPSSDDPGASALVPRLSGMEVAGAPGTSLPEAGRGPLAVALALPGALRPLVLAVRADGNEVVLDLRAPGRDASPPVVRLGPPDRITGKLTAAATVLARTSVNGVAVLDVRVPESPTVTRFRR